MHRRLRPLAATALVTLVALCSPIARGVFAQSFGNAIQTAETERFLIDAPIVRLGKTLGRCHILPAGDPRTQRHHAVRRLEDDR